MCVCGRPRPPPYPTNSTSRGSGADAPAGMTNQPLTGWPPKPAKVTSYTSSVASPESSTRTNRASSGCERVSARVFAQKASKSPGSSEELRYARGSSGGRRPKRAVPALSLVGGSDGHTPYAPRRSVGRRSRRSHRRGDDTRGCPADAGRAHQGARPASRLPAGAGAPPERTVSGAAGGAAQRRPDGRRPSTAAVAVRAGRMPPPRGTESRRPRPPPHGRSSPGAAGGACAARRRCYPASPGANARATARLSS